MISDISTKIFLMYVRQKINYKIPLRINVISNQNKYPFKPCYVTKKMLQISKHTYKTRGVRRGRDLIWLLDLQLPMPSVIITTKVVSSNPDHAMCTWYNIM